MSIPVPYIPVPKEFYFDTLKCRLTPTQKSVFLYVAGKIYEWPKTREENAVQLSCRYIGQAIGIQFQHVASALKALVRKGKLIVTKGVTPHAASIIRLTIPPVTCSVTPALEKNTAEVVENTAIAKESTPVTKSVTPPSHVSLQDQKSISKNQDQESQDSDSSSKNTNEENNKKVSCNNNTSNCFYESKNNSFAENLPRPAVPAVKNEFTALGAVLPDVIPAAPVATTGKEKAKSTASDSSGQVSDKVLSEGKKILSVKGLDCEIVVSRILTDMCKHNIRCRDRYFLAACKNEKVSGLASSPQSTAPDHMEDVPVKKQVNTIDKMKVWEKEKETEDIESIAKRISEEDPEGFYRIIKEVDRRPGMSFITEPSILLACYVAEYRKRMATME